jgi:REP element-mobilizing transposase RayT
MQIGYGAHGAYHHQYYIVWMPKYRKRILKGELKRFIEEHVFEVQN